MLSSEQQTQETKTVIVYMCMATGRRWMTTWHGRGPSARSAEQ